MLGLGANLANASTLANYFSDYSVAFDGNQGYIELGSTFQTVFRGSFTISAWVNFDDQTPGSSHIFGHNDDGNNFLSLSLGGDGNWRFEFMANEEELGSGGLAVDAGFSGNSASGCIHVAVSVINAGGGALSTMEMYVNGSSIGTNSNNLTSTDHDNYTISQNLFIGGNNFDDDGGTSTTINGKIDDVAMWDVALSDATVTAVYNSGSPFDLTGNSGGYNNSGDLVGYWKFEEGTGTTVADSSTNNITGTFNNGVSWDSSTP